MTTADELVTDCRIDPAIGRLEDDVRSRPREAGPRFGLFALLAMTGQWDRAVKQLDVIDAFGLGAGLGFPSPQARALISAERERTEVFSRGESPRLIEGARDTLALAADAWHLVANGDPAGALARLEAAEERRLPIRGRLAGEPFTSLIDADDLLRPILEVITPEGYGWIAWDSVQFLAVKSPSNLLEVLWTPAQIATSGGLIGRVVLPGLYPGTWAHPDDHVRLGRRTDWFEVGEGLSRGVGPKMFSIDGVARSLWDLTDLSLGTSPDEQASEPPLEIV